MNQKSNLTIITLSAYKETDPPTGTYGDEKNDGILSGIRKLGIFIYVELCRFYGIPIRKRSVKQL